MKITKLWLSCLLTMTLNLSSAHSPNDYTSAIYLDGDGWHIRLTFGTAGIVESVKKHSKNYDVDITDKALFNQLLDSYLKQHISILTNKEDSCSLSNFAASINHHSTDVFYDLSDLKGYPLFWEIQIDALKENLQTPNNLVIVNTGSNSNSFQLIKENSFRVKLMRLSDGEYKKVN